MREWADEAAAGRITHGRCFPVRVASVVPTIVNVMLNPRADRKPQKYGWLTR